jgi:hypothetical protein
MILDEHTETPFRGVTLGRLKEILAIFNLPDDYLIGPNHVGNLLILTNEKDGHENCLFINAKDESINVFDEGF